MTTQVSNGNWVMWGREGGLDSLGRNLHIKTNLEKSEQRLRQQLFAHHKISN